MYNFTVQLFTEDGRPAEQNSTGKREMFTGVVYLGEVEIYRGVIRGAIRRRAMLGTGEDTSKLKLAIINQFAHVLYANVQIAQNT